MGGGVFTSKVMSLVDGTSLRKQPVLPAGLPSFFPTTCLCELPKAGATSSAASGNSSQAPKSKEDALRRGKGACGDEMGWVGVVLGAGTA